MGDYIYRKWDSTRKEGSTLFSMLSLRMKVYTIFVFFSMLFLIVLTIAGLIPGSRFHAIYVFQLFGIPYFTPWIITFMSVIIMLIVLAALVSPIDRNTEKSRINDYYTHLNSMLEREGVADASLCEAICASLESASEQEARRQEFTWGFLSAMLLFIAGTLSAFLVDSLIEKGIDAVASYVWLYAAFAFIIIIVAVFLIYFFFSAKAYAPRLKARCATDLRIAFYMCKATGAGIQRSRPQHMR